MADNKSNVGKPDRDLISLSEDYEVKYWSTKFGVSSAELISAVNAVGNIARDVEEYLKNKKDK